MKLRTALPRLASPPASGPVHVAGSGRMLALAVAALLVTALGAGEAVSPVINYRNDGTGVYPEAQPPLRWNATTNAPENVVWNTPLPGPAETSQPVIGGDRIFVLSTPFILTGLDKMNGKVLWQCERHAQPDGLAGSEEEKAFRLERYVEFCEREIIARFGSLNPTKPGRPLSIEERYQDAIWFRGIKADPQQDAARLQREYDAVAARIPQTWPGSNAEVTLTNNSLYPNYNGIASPVTDGAHVWAHLATGQVVCYDRDGKRLWMRLLVNEDGNLPPAAATGCYQAVTPLWHDGRLYVQRFSGRAKGEHSANLHCLDAATGATLWVRPAGRGGYAGPLAAERQGAWHILTPDGVFFRPDGTRLPGKYGAFFDVGGNAGPAPALDRATGTVYLSAGVRLPEAGQTTPKILWFLTGKGAPNQADNWLAQHVPEGEQPARRSETEKWKAREAAAPKGQQGKRGGVRDFTSPVVQNGVLYFLNSAFKVLSASDVSRDVLEEMYYAEPMPFSEGKGKPRGSQLEAPFIYTDLTIAGDYLFVHGWKETVILQTGPKYRLVAVCPHEPSMSNLVFDRERMYLRSLGHLWCLGSKESKGEPR